MPNYTLTNNNDSVAIVDHSGEDFNIDSVWGLEGDDVIKLVEGDNWDNAWAVGTAHTLAGTLYGGADNDTLVGLRNDDTFFGDDGVDETSKDGNDTIYGGGGNDKAWLGGGDDYYYGGSGWESIYGGSGNDFINAGSGDDIVDAGSGDDFMLAGGGVDTFYGGDGEDTLSYQEKTDTNIGVWVDLTAENRSYFGSGTNNYDHHEDLYFSIENVIGASGTDELSGDNNANKFWGRGGDDIIWGRGGNDYLYGGYGSDTLFGNDGNDVISGGTAFTDEQNHTGNHDTLYGGSGADLFLLSSRNFVNNTSSEDQAQARDFMSSWNSAASIVTPAFFIGASAMGYMTGAAYIANATGLVTGLLNLLVGDDGTDGQTNTHGSNIFNQRIEDFNPLEDVISFTYDNSKMTKFEGVSEGGGKYYLQFQYDVADTDKSVTINLDSGYLEEHRMGDKSFSTISDKNKFYSDLTQSLHEFHVRNLNKDQINSIATSMGISNYSADLDANESIYVMGNFGGTSEEGRIISGSDVKYLFGSAGKDVAYSNASGDDNIVGGASYIWTYSGDDVIYTQHGVQKVNAGTGNDTVYGGLGDDIIYQEKDSGRDVIYNTGRGSDSDSVFFADGITKENLWFEKGYSEFGANSNDLLISIAGTSSSVAFKNWFGNSNDRVAKIEVSGFVLEASKVQVLVDAVSSLKSSGYWLPGEGQMATNSNYSSYITAINNNWQAA